MSGSWCARVWKSWPLVALLAGCWPSVSAGAPLPRNRPLEPQTQDAIAQGLELEARSEEAWAALEARYRDGTITSDELGQLRIRWAAMVDERHARSRWTLELMRAGVDTQTAVLLPQATEAGDLPAIDSVLQAAGAAELPPELRLLHVGALWGMGKEGAAALVYREARSQDSVIAYYDGLLEEWLRGRAGDPPSGGGVAFAPADTDRAEALKQELRGRDAPGRFLLSYLDPPPPTDAIGVPLSSLRDDVVREVLEHHRVDLFYCYERQGGVDRLGAGEVVLEFGVSPFGGVEFCSVLPGADLRDAALRDCVCAAVREVRLPPPSGGGRATVRPSLTYPMKRR